MGAPRYRLVHWDLDGTLLDTRDDLVAATNHVRASFALDPLPAAAVTHLVGHGARVLVERVLGTENRALHDEGLRRLLEYYGEHCLDRTRPHPGVAELLAELEPRGVRFSVVTNKLERLSRRILDGLGLTASFAAIVGGDTFPEKKPHPRGVEHVRVLCGASREESLMVGDSSVDVETARAAGIACAGVLWGFDPEGLRGAAPAFLVGSSAELRRLILDGA